MPETEITVVVRVASPPRRARLENGGTVTNFRIASTHRRFDKARQEWVDGETFWSDVECWDDLGGNVVRSISKGDPVVVVGRLWTRDYESQNGRGSTSQIRADAVGPNLSWGWAEFQRTSRTVRAEDASAESPVAPDDVPADDAVTSEDYVDAGEAFPSVDPDEALREPALR